MIEPAVYIAGGAHFVFVFFKALQQRNVAFMHYRWIMPVSFAMSATEVFVLSVVAHRAMTMSVWTELIPLAVSLGVGGGVGAICSMWCHHRFIKPKVIE